MGVEDTAGLEGGRVVVLIHAPDVDIAFVVACRKQRTIASNADAGYGNVVLRDELMSALVIAKIPNHEYTTAVGTDQLALVGVNYHVVNGVVMGVMSLHES